MFRVQHDCSFDTCSPHVNKNYCSFWDHFKVNPDLAEKGMLNIMCRRTFPRTTHNCACCSASLLQELQCGVFCISFIPFQSQSRKLRTLYNAKHPTVELCIL